MTEIDERDNPTQTLKFDADAIHLATAAMADFGNACADVINATTDVCYWTGPGFSWHTTCGDEFYLPSEGTPLSEGMKYCCFCAKPIVEVAPNSITD
jgi:hypothetical protein